MTFPAFLPAPFKSALRTAFIMNMLRQWSLTSATKSLHWSTLILPHSCLKFYDGFVLISGQNFRCAIQNPCDVATQSSPPSVENGFQHSKLHTCPWTLRPFPPWWAFVLSTALSSAPVLLALGEVHKSPQECVMFPSPGWHLLDVRLCVLFLSVFFLWCLARGKCWLTGVSIMHEVILSPDYKRMFQQQGSISTIVHLGGDRFTFSKNNRHSPKLLYGEACYL